MKHDPGGKSVAWSARVTTGALAEVSGTCAGQSLVAVLPAP
jgi:hypothetical protein